jgi:O-antigen/teichoic acid export membrane protein
MSRSFVGHAAIYGLATFLLQAAGFVLLPLYLRCLSREEYGVMEVATRLAETAGTLLLFGGFRQALFALYAQADSTEEKRQVVCSVYALLACGALGGVAVAVVLPAYTTLDPLILRLAIVSVVVEPFVLIPLSLLQARTQSLLYVSVVGGQFLLRVALAVTLVAGLGWGVVGVLGANIAAAASLGVALSVGELARGLAWPSWAETRRLLAFALPLVPGGACFFILHHGDRFFLLHHVSPAAIGEYGLAYKLAMLVTTFGLGPLYMVWSAKMYSVAKQPDAGVIFGQAITRILAWFMLVGLFICLFVEDGIAWMGGHHYLAAVPLIPAIVLACAFQAFATLADGGLYVRRRTDRKFVISLISAAVILVLYALLIPLAGVRGAALATVLGFATLASLTYFTSQQLFPVRYEWSRLAGLCGIVVSVWGLSLMGLPFFARCGLFLLAPLLYTLLVTNEEWQRLTSWLRWKTPRMELTQE